MDTTRESYPTARSVAVTEHTLPRRPRDESRRERDEPTVKLAYTRSGSRESFSAARSSVSICLQKTNRANRESADLSW